MLSEIKTLLGISLSDTSKDTILNYLITECTNYGKQFTHSTTIPDYLVIQMCIYRYNRLGSEGLNSESYSGASFNYNDDFPAHIISGLKSCRLAVFK